MHHNRHHHLNHSEHKANEIHKEHSHYQSNYHKHKNHFNAALWLVIISISIIALAFISEGGLTGFAVKEPSNEIEQLVVEFDDFKSLESLSPGNYYVDGEGNVYWLDGSLVPVVAKVRNIEESQKNRHIYIDDRGNVGFVIR